MADTEHQEDEDKRCTLFDRKRTFCQRCSEFHTSDEWMESCERYMGAAPIRQCKTCGGWHPTDRWSGNCFPEPNWNRSELASPDFISDTFEMKSLVNGKTYTSKTAFYRHARESGCFIEEPGSQPKQREVTEREIENDIAGDVKKSLEQLRNGTLTDDAMANMMQAPAEGVNGFHVE